MDPKLLMRKKHELLVERQKILDAAAKEERGYSDEERAKVQELQKRVAELDEQLAEAKEIERQKAGIPRDQPPVGEQTGDPAPSDAPRFRNLGDFVREVHDARSGRFSDRFTEYRKAADAQLRAMNFADGTSLGFLIPDQFEAGTLMLTGTGGYIRSRARVIPAGEYPDAKFRKRVAQQGAGGVYNGILINYTGEGVAPVDESKLEYYLFTLDPSDKKIGLFYITTEEGLQNPTAVSADMEMSLRGALAEWEDDVFITGDGVGKPRGILKSPGRLELARDTSADFKFADVVQMAKYMYPRAASRNWELSLDLYDKVAQMSDGASRLIMIAGDATKGIPDLLHGRPIHWSEINPTLGNTGDAILADWSFYFIKDGSGPFFATDPYTRFMEGEVRVKMSVKMDGDTWIREPLKLKNGMEVSPFVVLKA